MNCKHERLRTVGDAVFCCACGEKLTLEFLMAKGKPEEEKTEAEPKPKKQARKKTVKG